MSRARAHFALGVVGTPRATVSPPLRALSPRARASSARGGSRGGSPIGVRSSANAWERDDDDGMHSAGYRVNAVLTMAFTGLIALCVAVALTDVFHRASPDADLKVHGVHYFTRVGANDEAVLSFSMKTDLSSCFSWNTKQLFAYIKVVYETEKHRRNEVTVWDKVITDPEASKIDETFLSKYRLVDNGSGLRGRPVNLTLTWNVMPHIGTLTLSSIDHVSLSRARARATLIPFKRRLTL